MHDRSREPEDKRPQGALEVEVSRRRERAAEVASNLRKGRTVHVADPERADQRLPLLNDNRQALVPVVVIRMTVRDEEHDWAAHEVPGELEVGEIGSQAFREARRTRPGRTCFPAGERAESP